METKIIEGIEYILKSDVDELVRSRLSKVSERARIAESKVSDLEKSVEANKAASSQLADLQLQIESLTGELEQSKNLYSTHSTIAKHGFIDPDLRDLVEWQYKRSTKDLPKKEKPDLDTWITNLKSDPTKASEALRPFLTKPKVEEGAAVEDQPQIESMDRQQLIELAQAAYQRQNQQEAQKEPNYLSEIKNHSTSVLPKPPTQKGNLIDRALADPTNELWRKHNKEIREMIQKEQRIPSAFLNQSYKYPQE